MRYSALLPVAAVLAFAGAGCGPEPAPEPGPQPGATANAPAASSAANGPADSAAAGVDQATLDAVGKPAKPYKLVLIVKTRNNPFFEPMIKAAEAEAKSLG